MVVNGEAKAERQAKMDLDAVLPQLIPAATAWAMAEADRIVENGQHLTTNQVALARRVKVAHPELVRIMHVDRLPVPEDPLLREVALAIDLPNMAGLTLGHGIYLVRGHDEASLVAHELRHVHQYEQMGGIEPFMAVYLAQIAAHGYHDAPLEQDARDHEYQAR